MRGVVHARPFWPSVPLLYYAKEDTSDTAGDGGYVGPNYGGQNYDVEFLGVAQQGSRIFLNSSGYTVAHNSPSLSHPAAQTAGSVWKDSEWIMDPIAPATPAQFRGGTYLGMADYVYTRDSVTQQHSIIEASFDTALFGDVSAIEIVWGPACGNDVLSVSGEVQVPEPHVGALLALRLAGFAFRRRVLRTASAG